MAKKSPKMRRSVGRAKVRYEQAWLSLNGFGSAEIRFQGDQAILTLTTMRSLEELENRGYSRVVAPSFARRPASYVKPRRRKKRDISKSRQPSAALGHDVVKSVTSRGNKIRAKKRRSKKQTVRIVRGGLPGLGRRKWTPFCHQGGRQDLVHVKWVGPLSVE